MFCFDVPGGGINSCQGYSGDPIFDRKARSRKDWIDATISKLLSYILRPVGQTDRKTGDDTYPVIDLVTDQSTGSLITEGSDIFVGSRSSTMYFLWKQGGLHGKVLLSLAGPGCHSIEAGTVSKTTYIAKGGCTFEMTDKYGDGICGQFCTGKFNIFANGEAGAISSSGEFRAVVRKGLDVVGAILGPPSTTDWRS